MLSILIPIYNHDTFPLVEELHKQCLECNMEFEILCQDDCSPRQFEQNKRINHLTHCSFSINKTNMGISCNRNFLARKAQYDWILLLDCDTFPKASDYMAKQLVEIQKNVDIAIFGGTIYNSQRPPKDQLLRWVYGRRRESVPIKKRIQNPIKTAFTYNLLLKKEYLLRHPFDEQIILYGYEDLSFLSVWESHNLWVSHIENPVIHQNQESSSIFLEKTNKALKNLVYLYQSHKLTAEYSKVIAAYGLVKKLQADRVIAWFFRKTNNRIQRQLLGANPSIRLFDLYKLGYFCALMRQ